ncbi:MAG: LytTR family DNA-binding domain-containing protein [Lachnospiraceae bacterium]|nr:LytTR family DNA-binding domain-containing protein [Lachnospiraceae bacterium]
MLSIYLCEDNQNQLIYLERIIKNFIFIEELDMELTCTCITPNTLLKCLHETQHPGLYFLDIELNAHIDGFQLAEQIRKFDPRGYIVFITSHSELSYLSFEKHVEAMDFILKDYPKQLPSRILECMKKALELYSSIENNVHKTLSIKIGSRNIYVPIDDIYSIKSSDNNHKLILLTNYSIYEFYNTLQNIHARLDSSFFQCHKSCIVNLNYVKEIDKTMRSIQLKNGQTCPLSARNYTKLKQYLKKYHANFL